jgi:hypothetical protein
LLLLIFARARSPTLLLIFGAHTRLLSHCRSLAPQDSESGDLLGSSLTKSNRAVFHLAERMKETGGQRMRVVAYARCNKHGTWASEPVLASGRR